jgi:uncharacterized DUF497 family protein
MENIELRWTQEVIDKLFNKHGVVPEEVDEVIYGGNAILRRGPESGKGRRYYVLGKTFPGRYLMIVLERQRGALFSVVTCRSMKDDEKRLYRKLKR